MIVCLLLLLLTIYQFAFGWGFYAHRQINSTPYFFTTQEMLAFLQAQPAFYKIEHAVDPDKRRYMIAEGPRHYIDIDRYGNYPLRFTARTWFAMLKNIQQIP